MFKVFFIVVILLLAGGIVATCFAQQGPNMFGSYADAKTAYDNVSYSYYQPKYFDNHGVNPVNGQNKIAAPLPEDAIIELMTVNGQKFVIQQKGTMMRWENNVPYARDDCGNEIFFYSPLKVEQVTESLAFKNGRDGINGKDGIGINGRDGKDGRDGIAPVEIATFPWTTLILTSGFVAIVYLTYLGVKAVIDYYKKEDSSVIAPPGVDTGGVYKKLEPNRGFVLGFSSSF